MRGDLEFIGELVLTQVQNKPLKTGGAENPYYDPGHLIAVPEVLITQKGALGIGQDGGEILDVHHADHPQSRFGGSNGISIGFSASYERMRARFGDHLVDGVAGENLIISGPLAPGPGDLQGSLLFENPDGSRHSFEVIKHMAPCREFSHYVNRSAGSLPASVIKETLQFLDGGVRGYTLRLIGAVEARLASGARLYSG